MELFKILGTIAVNNQDANAALAETSGKAKKTAQDVGEVGESGSKSSGKFANAMSKIGGAAVKVGKVAAVGIAAAGTAIGGLTVKALNSAGELEQNMGGSEAVFGKYADSIQSKAKEAFSKMGLSTSDYLATANKMGALFKGAGFETKEALDLSSESMQRAADVASIMGIDTSAAMEAVAGAAKGNFTMMDNLGVAMNDTTLNAYAMEKGLNKTTQEMTNQEKIGLAMEMFLDKTSYAAGNYAKENETLAGSLGTAKAALQNFLSGSGTVDQLVGALSGAADVIVKNINDMFPSLMSGLTELVNKIVPMIPPLLKQLLPGLISGAVDLINGLVQAFPSIMSAIMGVLPQLVSGVRQIIVALIQALPEMMQALVDALPTLIRVIMNALEELVVTLCTVLPQIIQPIIDALPELIPLIVGCLVDSLPAIIEGLITLMMAIVEALPQIIQALVDALPTIIDLIITALIQNLPVIIAGLVQVVVGIVQALPQIFSSLVEGIKAIFSGIWDGIKLIFEPVVEWFSNLWGSLKANPALTDLCTFIEDVWAAVKSVVSTVVNAIKNVVSTVWDSIKNNVTTVLNAIKNVFSTVWNSIKNVVSTVINSVKNVISTVWNAIKTIIANVMNIIFSVIKGDWTSVKQSITNIINAIKSVISSVWNAIKAVLSSVMNGIKNTISSVWNGIKSVVSSVVNGIKNTISSVFNGIKSVATSVWNGIKTAMTKPIEKARDTIKGIVDKVKGFFTGMKLQFPNIKLPHFSVSPSGWSIGDLLKGSIPRLGIEWYAKAVNAPMLLTDSTIFGYNPQTGNALAGGETEDEVIFGVNPLMRMIQTAVSEQNSTLIYYLQQLIAMLSDYFPQLIEAAGHDIYLNKRLLVGGMINDIDEGLGRIAIRKGRGQ